MSSNSQATSAYKKLLVSTVCGQLVGAATGIFISLKFVPLAIWDTVALVYSVWTWLSIWPQNAKSTKEYASREDPGKGVTDTILNIASFASLVAVGFVLIEGSKAEGIQKGAYAAFGLLSIVLSWLIIHTLYTLKYAELYYREGEKVDFNQTSPPKYSDFAYLAFTVGMTFQVSDTNIKSSKMRQSILHHSHLSFFYSTIIIASMINLVVNLSK